MFLNFFLLSLNRSEYLHKMEMIRYVRMFGSDAAFDAVTATEITILFGKWEANRLK